MITSLVVYVATALLFAMIPGPDFAVILRISLLHGRRQAILASIGVGCGLCVHTALSVLGLSAVIAHSPLLFACVTYAGALYLAWLGVHGLFPNLLKKKQARDADREIVARAKEPSADRTSDRTSGTKRALSAGQAFSQGFLCNVLNPKALLFFLTFLPQFLVPTSSIPLSGQLLILGLCSCVVTGGWFVFLSIMLSRLRPVFENQTFRRRLEQATSVVFLGFSVKLLASHV